MAEEQEALRRGDRQTAIRLSGGFHMAVAAICGEGALTQFLRSLISRSSLVIALYGRGPASACGHDEHVAISSTRWRRATATRAAAAMGEHLDTYRAISRSPRDRIRHRRSGNPSRADSSAPDCPREFQVSVTCERA